MKYTSVDVKNNAVHCQYFVLQVQLEVNLDIHETSLLFRIFFFQIQIIQYGGVDRSGDSCYTPAGCCS